MNKLGKKREAAFDAAKEAVTEAAEVLRSGIERYNDRAEEIIAEANAKLEGALEAHVKPKVEAYNDALAEARDLIEGVTADQESYYDNRSERWQESDRGGAYCSWKDEWESAGRNLDAIEVEVPDALDVPALDEPEWGYEDLDELPTSFEY